MLHNPAFIELIIGQLANLDVLANSLAKVLRLQEVFDSIKQVLVAEEEEIAVSLLSRDYASEMAF